MSDAPAPDVERRPTLRARQLATVAVLCLAALAVVAAAVGFGGGHDLDDLPASVESDEEPEADEPPVEEGAEGEETLEPPTAVTYEIYLDRDPFEPVRTPPSDETADEDDDTIVVDPDDGDPDDPSDPTDPSDPSDPTDPSDPSDPTDPSDPSDPGDPSDPSDPRDPDDGAECAGGEDEAVCNGHVLTLHDIESEGGTDVAVIQVDSTVYEVREGEGFAERFQLLRIDREDNRVHGLFGDARFTLRVGERTLK